MPRLADVLLAAVGVALAVAAAGILAPAPTRGLLPLSVGAPELSPGILLLSIAAAALAARPPRTPLRAWSITAAVLAAVAAAVPLVRIAPTVRAADARLTAALGDGYLARIAPETRRRLRERSVTAWELFTGLHPGQVRVTRGIRFADREGAPLTLDVYQPAAGGGPILVQLYGGAWQRGAPGDNEPTARYLASRGYVVVGVAYRHAPAWRWPAQLDDVRSALAWVRGHAAAYDGDPSRIGMIGRSSGGHLALTAAYASATPGLRAVVSLYGPTDLAGGYQHVPWPDPIGVRRTLEALMGGTPAELPRPYREASPLTYAGTRQPATLQIIGARDHIVLPRFPRSLDDRLRAAGNVSVLVEIPWADHAFDAVPFGPSAQIALYTMERFLAATLGPAAGAASD